MNIEAIDHLKRPETQRMVFLAVQQHFLNDGRATVYVDQGHGVEFKIVKWKYGDPMEDEVKDGRPAPTDD